jgi:hypothetical protein
LHWIGTVARTLASCAVRDVEFGCEWYGGFRITLSKTIEKVVGEYGSSSLCEGWFLRSSAYARINTLSITCRGKSDESVYMTLQKF